ncbi:protein virilizer homolog [Punica granatum]|nr:protein virilizer homolog [Punica granatum]
MRKANTAQSPSGMDEVEQLLQAAHDDVLLKLSLNSHVARSASHSLDPDLSRRFQSLKSPPPAPSLSRPKPSPPPPQVDDELKTVLADDLSARFAALRGSLHPSSSSSSSPSVASTNLVPSGSSLACDGRGRDPSCSNPDDEEDEVEKIIQWAKDAARLDPSPPFDEEPRDDDEDEDSDLETSSSDDDDAGDSHDKAKRTENRPRQRGNPK